MTSRLPWPEREDSSSSGIQEEQIIPETNNNFKLNNLEIEAGINLEDHELHHHHQEQDLVSSSRRSYGKRGTGSVSRKDWKPEPRWVVIGRYSALSTLSALLAITCPGETKLWWTRTGDRPLIKYSQPVQGGSSSYSTASESDGAVLNWGRLLIIVTLYLLTIVAFFLLQGSDPGYISHAVLDELAKLDERFLLDALPEDDNNDDNNKRENDHWNTVDNEERYYQHTRRRACSKCNFAPPLRAHHCRICDKCVATFDHHCAFVGTCIGERNHCRFWWFLFAQMLALHACATVVSTSQLGVITLLQNEYIYVSIYVIFTELFLYMVFMVAFLVWAIHTVLALTNSTTFECGMGADRLEYLRGTRPTDLPFSRRHCHENIRLFCCQRDAACHDYHLPLRFLMRGGNTTSSSWVPIGWTPPGRIVRDSDDWWEHPWQNKYWSCC